MELGSTEGTDSIESGSASPWATPTITLNTYVGEWPDTDQETSAIMDAALGQVPRMCPPAKRLG